VRDECFDGTDVLDELTEPEVFQELAAGFDSAFEFKGDHAAVKGPALGVGVLPPGEVALGKGVEAGVVDAFDGGVLLKREGEEEGVLRVLADAQGQGFQAAACEPGLERGLDGAGSLADEAEAFEEGLIARRDGAAEGGGVTLDVLGCGDDADVGTEIERPLDDGGEERVVHDQRDGARLGDGGDRGDVSEFERGVGGRLDENELGGGLDGAFDGARIGRVDEVGLDAEVREDLAEEADGAAVHAAADDGVIALLEEGEKDGGFGGEAGGEGDGGRGGLEGAELVLEGGDGGVGDPGVGVRAAGQEGCGLDQRGDKGGGEVFIGAPAVEGDRFDGEARRSGIGGFGWIRAGKC
jgi:hypothetical protein